MSEITEVESDYEPGSKVSPDYDDDGSPIPWTGGYYAGTGTISYEVSGSLRDRVIEKTGASSNDRVFIDEVHWDSGYCPTCSYENLDFKIRVNEEIVYDSREHGYFGEESVFAVLNAWLNGETEDE